MTERQMQLEDWLDDLCVRFIINLPGDSLESVERICFQVEEAQWFYEDFIRPLDPNLPSLSLRNFCLRIFTHCPLLSAFAVDGRHMQAFEEFLTYKKRIPVRGAIMLNEAMDAAVLVKGWKKGANWSFPRGKINKDEDDLICAIREVYEETGFDVEAAGLIPDDRDVKYIEVNMREQQMRLYVFKNVPMDTYFEPRTRKEISKIQWWRLSELPAFKKKNQINNPETTTNANKFYMVAPFLVPLRKWVIEQKKLNAKRAIGNQYLPAGASHDEFMTEEDRGEESATQATYDVSAPESSSLEEATEALSRLLKIQPPTQGLQSEGLQLPQSKNSGQALLALLQSKPANPNLSTMNPPPESPFEHTRDLASASNSLHHHLPHLPRLPDMPPPPQFPAHVFDNTFSYQVPNFHRQSHPEQMIQGHPQGQRSMPHQSPNSRQPQHLIHPQPLPPHVQRAVFTGGAVHSPLMPQPVQQYDTFQPNHNIAHIGGNMIPQFPGLHAPMVQQVQRQSPSHLTSHSLSLLNAFKGRDQAAIGGSVSSGFSLSPLAQGPSAARDPPPRPQELPAEHLTSKAPVAHNPQLTVQPHLDHSSSRQLISANQKSTLLDLFKSPTTQVTIPSKVLTATALPTSNTPSAVELSAVEPLSSTPNDPDSNVQNGTIPELNPEVNLPFGAMSILARPAGESKKHIRSQQAPHKYQKPSSEKKTTTSTIGKRQAAQPISKVFQPQILKRPQPGSSKEVVPPILPSPKLSPVAPPPFPERQVAAFPSQPALPTGHKQTLLSLFGKSSPVATVSPNNSLIEQSPTIGTNNPPTRSRVGSLASGEGASRRGSQNPISSADKGFLLSYLDAVVGGNQR